MPDYRTASAKDAYRIEELMRRLGGGVGENLATEQVLKGRSVRGVGTDEPLSSGMEERLARILLKRKTKNINTPESLETEGRRLAAERIKGPGFFERISSKLPNLFQDWEFGKSPTSARYSPEKRRKREEAERSR